MNVKSIYTKKWHEYEYGRIQHFVTWCFNYLLGGLISSQYKPDTYDHEIRIFRFFSHSKLFFSFEIQEWATPEKTQQFWTLGSWMDKLAQPVNEMGLSAAPNILLKLQQNHTILYF